MGGSEGDEASLRNTPPLRGGRGRGMTGSRRPTLVHLGTQETMDEVDRSASLIAIQEAHRIMLMHHCRQSWEESEQTIGFGLPLIVTTEPPHLMPELNKEAATGSVTTPLASVTRQLDMEPLDPNSPSQEPKKAEPLIPHRQTPGRDWKTGGAKGKQNTRNLATETRPEATRQVDNGRGKPRKAADSPPTNLLVDTEANKDAYPPTKQRTHSQLSDRPQTRAEDTSTGSTQGSKTEIPRSPQKSSLRPQTGYGPQPAQTVTSVNARDSELLTGLTPQRLADSDQGPQPGTTVQGGLIPTKPPRKANSRKALSTIKDEDRQGMPLTGPTPQRQVDSDQGPQPGPTVHEGLIPNREGPSGPPKEIPVPILTPTQLQSVAKRRRQQLRAAQKPHGLPPKNPPNHPTACFYLTTRVLTWTEGEVLWTPIFKLGQGDTVVQTIPSGHIDDLAGAKMTVIKTVCTFDGPDEGIDMVQIGEAFITAHHHVRTAEGWITARQATQHGWGRLISNVHLERVYNLLLEGGGNIIINTTSNQEAPSITEAATMGYRIEETKDSEFPGSLTYPQASLQRLGQHRECLQDGNAFGSEIQRYYLTETFSWSPPSLATTGPRSIHSRNLTHRVARTLQMEYKPSQ